jgi:hypothetical protein
MAARSLLLVVMLSGLAQAANIVEHRAVFEGTARERIAAVPFYHMPPLPEPDFAWGMYFDYNRIPEQYRRPEYVRLCMRHMAKHGLNTTTLYGDAETAAAHLDMALAEGLVGVQPVMLLGAGPEGALRMRAREGCPELVGYGPDEPKPEDAKAVADAVRDWHKAGFRCATAIKAESLNAAGKPLDVWVVNARGLTEKCVRTGKDLWMYECRFRGTNQLLHRYWTGIYSFAMHKRFGVKACWTWGYLHDDDSLFRIGREGTWRFDTSGRYEHALCGPEGPIGTVGLDGMAQGIDDFKVLHALDDAGGAKGFVARLVESIPSEFWRGTDLGVVPLAEPDMWDVHDTAAPLVDVEETMRVAIALLVDAKKGY